MVYVPYFGSSSCLFMFTSLLLLFPWLLMLCSHLLDLTPLPVFRWVPTPSPDSGTDCSLTISYDHRFPSTCDRRSLDGTVLEGGKDPVPEITNRGNGNPRTSSRSRGVRDHPHSRSRSVSGGEKEGIGRCYRYPLSLVDYVVVNKNLVFDTRVTWLSSPYNIPVIHLLSCCHSRCPISL